MSLCLGRDAKYPISGVPRALHAAKATQIYSIGSRHVLSSTNSVRWAGRTKSQQQRSVEWRPPAAFGPPAEKEDIIANYSAATHLLGSATATDLMPASMSLQYRGDDFQVEPQSGVDEYLDSVHTRYAELPADGNYTFHGARDDRPPWASGVMSVVSMELDATHELPRPPPSELEAARRPVR